MLEKFDLTDKRILYELDINSRIPLTKLSRKLRLSREKVNYRINNLVKKEVIRKFVTMINPSKLGYSIYKMYFKFQNLSKEKEQEIINWLTENTFIYWLATANGKWDLNMTIFAKDIHDFDLIISKFISKYSKHIAEQEVNTTLKVGILNKDWILPGREKRRKAVYVGGKVDNIKIDKIDVEILRILANNGRMNATEIAAKIKSTERKVIYRMKLLEKKEIILGYTTSLNVEILGMQFFKSIIYLNVMSEETKEKIISYCKNNPNIGFFIFCVGSWPLELELIVRDNQQFYEIINDLRQKFPEIRGYETVIFPKEYKFDWMPLCYKVEK